MYTNIGESIYLLLEPENTISYLSKYRYVRTLYYYLVRDVRSRMKGVKRKEKVGYGTNQNTVLYGTGTVKVWHKNTT